MRYTFVKQHDATDCAAACMAMVCLHYRKEMTLTKLRDIMGTDLKGTNLIGLTQCAGQLGFTSQAADWLKEGGCEMVAMESTASYWKPLFNILESSDLKAMVVNARHMKVVPGRKTDVKDAE